MSAGAVEGLVKTQAEWEDWRTQNPGQCYENQADLPPPFYVISRAINKAGAPPEYLHHLVTVDMAREILQAGKCRAKFRETRFIEGVVFEQLPKHTDRRGHLVQLFRKDELQRLQRNGGPRIDYPPMAYLSQTEPGVARGPHEHLTQTDLFIFCRSQFEIFLWDNREHSHTHWCRLRLTTTADDYWRLIIPPGVVHAYRALGGVGTVINCPDKLYGGWEQSQPLDEIRHEADPLSPFQLLWTV